MSNKNRALKRITTLLFVSFLLSCVGETDDTRSGEQSIESKSLGVTQTTNDQIGVASNSANSKAVSASGPVSKIGREKSNSCSYSEASTQIGTTSAKFLLQSSASPLDAKGEEYIKMCEDEGVEIPLSFPGGPPPWQSLGVIPGSGLWVGPGQEPGGQAELFSWTSYDGNTTCMALLRSINGRLVALGVICYNRNKGKSCFFDKKDGISLGDEMPLDGFRTPKDGIIGGPNGGTFEDCMSCHKGGNPFVITPPIRDLRPPGSGPSDEFHTPIGPFSPGSNAPYPNPAVCSSCHAMPKLTPEYCLNIIFPALTGATPYMPPGGRDAESAGILSECCSLIPRGTNLPPLYCISDE